MAIRSPELDDVPYMLKTLQSSSVTAYAELGITTTALRRFVRDPEYIKANCGHWEAVIRGEDPDTLLRVDRIKGRVVGIAESGPHPTLPGVRVVRSLYVCPRHQRQGRGLGLLGAILPGREPVYLYTTIGSGAVGFYESQHFVPTGRTANNVPDDPAFMPPRPLDHGFALPQMEMHRPGNDQLAESV